MSSGRFLKQEYQAQAKTDYENAVKEIKSNVIKNAQGQEDQDLKKLLTETPNFNIVSNIESELLYDAKLRLALSKPQAYFDAKKEELVSLAKKVNEEFKNTFNSVNKYASREEAKKMAIEAAKNVYTIGMHKINSEYPEKLDKDLEHKILFELKTKLDK